MQGGEGGGAPLSLPLLLVAAVRLAACDQIAATDFLPLVLPPAKAAERFGGLTATVCDRRKTAV